MIYKLVDKKERAEITLEEVDVEKHHVMAVKEEGIVWLLPTRVVSAGWPVDCPSLREWVHAMREDGRLIIIADSLGECMEAAGKYLMEAGK